jgi:hypothetical protein
MIQEIRSSQEHIKEVMETQFGSLVAKLNGWRKQMEADQKVSKTTDLKSNPEEMESEAEHWELPKEDSIAKPVKGLRKRHWGQMLAEG